MDKKNNATLNGLISISRKIGADINLVQGAGGNTSVKENGVLWVKASGCRLVDAKDRDIFVPVDYSRMVQDLHRDEGELLVPQMLRVDGDSTLRPSIETSLHALMPHRYVIHVHSVNTIANAVLLNGEAKILRLFEGINWVWVPYVRPGLPLTRLVQGVMRPGLNVLVLANHGLVLGAKTEDEIFKLLNELENRLYRPQRETSVVDRNKIMSLVKGTEYEPLKYDLVHSIAFDPIAISIAGHRSLYPDHVVFLGEGPMPIMSEEILCCFFKEKKPRIEHKAIVIEGVGVIKHRTLSESAEEMLHCLANVLMRIQPGDKVRYLTEREESEISEWDAEKFRKKTQS